MSVATFGDLAATAVGRPPGCRVARKKMGANHLRLVLAHAAAGTGLV